MNEETKECLGKVIDRVENLNSALSMSVPDSIHVEAMRESMPEVIADLKNIYIGLTGENPWQEADKGEY